MSIHNEMNSSRKLIGNLSRFHSLKLWSRQTGPLGVASAIRPQSSDQKKLPWNLGKLNHVAIAVPDIEKASSLYRDVMEATVSEVMPLPEHGVYTVFIDLGNTKIELLHPLGDNSPIESFLKKKPEVEEDLKYLYQVYNTVTDREQRHIDLVKVFAKQDHPEVCRMADNITVHYPEDIYAVKWSFFVSRKTGQFDLMLDLMARAVHHCPKSSSLYPYILSMYGFSLEENNMRDLAEEVCLRSISIQPKNPWGIHAMSHVFEEERDVTKGVEFLTGCRGNWELGPFVPHIAWHLMLYYIDLDDIDKVLAEYDNTIAPKIDTSNVLRLLDAASVLWRLNVAGIDPGPHRWEQVTTAFKPRIGKCQLSWLDSHLMMSLSYGKVTESTARLTLAREMMTAMEEHSMSTGVYDYGVARKLGVPLCNALLAFGEERYSDVIRIISPLKYDLIQVGGSGAQRQVFHVTLIHAAIRGKMYKEALANIIELKSRKPRSRYLQRLYDQVLELME